jgi:23S rRNA pseudouridine2457 synthase
MSLKKFNYYKIYKPYGVLSQFTDTAGRATLKNLYNFPGGVYPIGRLDSDSEGLLLLTDDKSLTDFLLNPANKHKREYLVQVEGIPEKRDLEKLKHGIVLKDRKTLPAEAEIISNPNLPPRYPSIRFRKNIPDCWLKIILTEGKNRQVRRMTAAIGFPTLRLVRVRMENIKIGNMNPGEVRALDEKELAGLIKIKKAVK